MRSSEISVSVCLSVCSYISKATYQLFTKFSAHVTAAVVRSTSHGSAIRYVLPVLWMTSCFHVMERMVQNQRRRVCFVQLARWRHPGRSPPSPIASCFYGATHIMCISPQRIRPSVCLSHWYIVLRRLRPSLTNRHWIVAERF